jgi:hypothetical protein
VKNSGLLAWRPALRATASSIDFDIDTYYLSQDRDF